MRLFSYRRAGAVVIDGDRVLLCSMQPPNQRRWWMFPGGGIERNESPAEAARRELLEETGVEADDCQEYLRAGIHGGEHHYYLISCSDLRLGSVSGPEADYAADADFRAEWVRIADLPTLPVFPRCVAEYLAVNGAAPREGTWVEDDRSAWDGVPGEPPHFDMRRSSRAVVVTEHGVAAIQRELNGERWFTLPGGGSEPDESPEQTVVREVQEELGLDVHPVSRLAVVFLAREGTRSLQTYLSCQVIGGTLGTGTGEEFTAERRPLRGAYQPVWLDPTDLPAEFRPVWLADRLDNWIEEPPPERPERFCEIHDD